MTGKEPRVERLAKHLAVESGKGEAAVRSWVLIAEFLSDYSAFDLSMVPGCGEGTIKSARSLLVHYGLDLADTDKSMEGHQARVRTSNYNTLWGQCPTCQTKVRRHRLEGTHLSSLRPTDVKSVRGY